MKGATSGSDVLVRLFEDHDIEMKFADFIHSERTRELDTALKMYRQLKDEAERKGTRNHNIDRSTDWPLLFYQKATERAWMRPSICTGRALR